MYKIPLTNSPNQTFNFSVPVNGENKYFKAYLSFNEVANYWNFSLTDAMTGQELFVNLPLLASMYLYSNILTQLDYLDIGSAYVAMIEETPNSAPDADDIGTNYVLLWSDNEMSEYDQ